MLRKIGKWVTITLFLSLVVAVLAVPSRANFSNNEVKVGTELKYDVTGTKCYVSWNFGFFINVTNVNETHAFGKVNDTADDDIDKCQVFPNGDNISLSIYVIRNVTDWEQRPNINNITTSQLLENWDTTHRNLQDSGVYEDTSRSTVSINFTISTNVPGAGEVSQNFKIAWDNTTGVLVEYTLVQTHPSDQQYSGMWSITLAETSLWGIPIGGIPSFPMEILMLAFATGICGVVLSKKMKRCSSA